MAVAFDAVGPSSSGLTWTSNATQSWTHTAGTGGGTVLVYLAMGIDVGGAVGAVGSFSSVTYGGNAMTLLGSVASNNDNQGAIFCYGITGQASGANTVAIGTYTPPSGSGFASGIGVSVSFTGGIQFGTAVTAYGDAASGSVAITTADTTGLCVAGVCDGSGGEAPTAGTQRWLEDLNPNSAGGNTIGITLASNGGTTTLSWTQTTDQYGVVGVEVQAGAGITAGPPLGLQSLARPPVVVPVISGWRNAGHSR